ncbi:hypothetical protein P7K49_002572 [Saguinus oedipus]|uniref:ATP-dependent RNA helicase n=1 Tax=Saguinus oedipus TaxID=9490 RepID=A0ABQ9WHS8_SAGOE|nr:hypothetical protein P7K49_002572 [Saguinus oedipus]
MGGSNRSAETQKLANGINIIVTTPGHLLDHMQNTPGFMHKSLQCLVIDEADCILDVGLEDKLKQIIKLLPTHRQTVLFSATQTQKVKDLARISLQRSPLYVGVNDEKTNATVDGLEQGYIVCPSEKRFLLLFTFLKESQKKKLMFYKADSGTLLCADVAARGLDVPEVDWIVQCDPPDDPTECLHHVPPFIDLNVNSNESKQKKQGGGGGFGYQKTKKVEKSKIFKHISKKSSDSKQFSH